MSYDSNTTIDGRTLDPEATFTHGEWVSRKLYGTWLGNRLNELKCKGWDPAVIGYSLVHALESSAEVEAKYAAEAEQGKLTREWKAVAEAARAFGKVIKALEDKANA